jgi:hypothetical protein
LRELGSAAKQHQQWRRQSKHRSAGRLPWLGAVKEVHVSLFRKPKSRFGLQLWQEAYQADASAFCHYAMRTLSEFSPSGSLRQRASRERGKRISRPGQLFTRARPSAALCSC